MLGARDYAPAFLAVVMQVSERMQVVSLVQLLQSLGIGLAVHC